MTFGMPSKHNLSSNKDFDTLRPPLIVNIDKNITRIRKVERVESPSNFSPFRRNCIRKKLPKMGSTLNLSKEGNDEVCFKNRQDLKRKGTRMMSI